MKQNLNRPLLETPYVRGALAGRGGVREVGSVHRSNLTWGPMSRVRPLPCGDDPGYAFRIEPGSPIHTQLGFLRGAPVLVSIQGSPDVTWA